MRKRASRSSSRIIRATRRRRGSTRSMSSGRVSLRCATRSLRSPTVLPFSAHSRARLGSKHGQASEGRRRVMIEGPRGEGRGGVHPTYVDLECIRLPAGMHRASSAGGKRSACRRCDTMRCCCEEMPCPSTRAACIGACHPSEACERKRHRGRSDGRLPCLPCLPLCSCRARRCCTTYTSARLTYHDARL